MKYLFAYIELTLRSCMGKGKLLSEMSMEELWQLFPIVLTAHRDEWTEWYGEEAALLHGQSRQ